MNFNDFYIGGANPNLTLVQNFIQYEDENSDDAGVVVFVQFHDGVKLDVSSIFENENPSVELARQMTAALKDHTIKMVLH